MEKIISIIYLFLLISGCERMPLFSGGDSIAVYLDLEPREVESLKEIEANLIVTNVSMREVTFTFPSGCQHGFMIIKDETVLIDSRNQVLCTMALSELKLKPGENETYPINLELLSDSVELNHGSYKLSSFLLEGYSTEAAKTFVVK
jgi:hypothetical protein